MDQPAWYETLSRDTWIGIAGIIIGIATAVYFYWRGKATKTLDYAIVSHTNLTTSKEFTNKWFLGLVPNSDDAGTVIELENAAVYNLRIKNTGRSAIVHSDYDSPPVIEAQGVIVDAVITDTAHESIAKVGTSLTPTDPDWHHVDLGATQSQIEVPLGLLNRNEWVEVQVLIHKAASSPAFKARLVGETRQTRHDRQIIEPTFRESLAARDSSTIFGLILGIVFIAGTVITLIFNRGS